MESVKAFCFSVCSAITAGGIFILIAPKASKKGVFRWVVSVFVLAGIISPLLSIGNVNIDDFFASTKTNAEISYSDKYDRKAIEKLQDITAQTLYSPISDIMKQAGYNGEFGLKVVLEKEKNGISVSCVNIYTEDLHIDEKEKLKSKLEKGLGLKAEISEGKINTYE